MNSPSFTSGVVQKIKLCNSWEPRGHFSLSKRGSHFSQSNPVLVYMVPFWLTLKLYLNLRNLYMLWMKNFHCML